METNQRPTLGNGKVCYIEIPSIEIDWKERIETDLAGEQAKTKSLGREPQALCCPFAD
jgi:hypothetical protein